MRHFLQQKDCINLLFEDHPGKKLVSDPHQKFEAELIANLATQRGRGFSQACGVPAMGCYLFLEKALYANGVLARTTALQQAPNLGG